MFFDFQAPYLLHLFTKPHGGIVRIITSETSAIKADGAGGSPPHAMAATASHCHPQDARSLALLLLKTCTKVASRC